ncbi:MAG: hypothetical protein ACE5G0_11565 [Rhodothermales bacterium]
MVSNQKKFGVVPSVAFADHLVDQHEQWVRVANFIMQYESMLCNKKRIVAQLTRVLGIKDIDPLEIVHELEGLSFESPGPKNESYHTINLYHRRHIIDGRPGSWKTDIDDILAKTITERHQEWFRKYGYSLDTL